MLNVFKVSGLKQKIEELADKVAGDRTLKVGFGVTEKTTYPDGTTVAQVAAWNEYGTETSPARPFFRNTIEDKQKDWGGAVGELLVAMGYNADQTLGLVGEQAKGDLTEAIIEFHTPANAESTIKAKGFDNPLQETGLMRDSIDYTVDKE